MPMPNPVVTIFAGVNGSGKSTLTEMLGGELDGVIIDPDKISRDFKLSSLGAGKKVILMVNECIESKESFSLETTFSGKLIINQIKKARENGFKITLHYVWLSSLEEHLQRVAQRVKLGGHDIPKDDIVRRYNSSHNQLIDNLDLYDELLIWDNSGEEITLCSISVASRFDDFAANPLSSIVKQKVNPGFNPKRANFFDKKN